MAVRTVFCTECGEKRRARFKGGEVVPFRESCPNCGSRGFRDAVGEE